MSNIFNEKFASNMREQLSLHHNVYKIPPKGEYLENLFYNALIKSGNSVDWKYFGHGPGKDIVVNDSNKVSVKTGQYKWKKTCIVNNSYRTTAFPTLTEKLKYFDEQEKLIDTYLFCIPTETKSGGYINYKYDIYYKNIPTKSNDYLWEETYTKANAHSGWKGTHKSGVKSNKITIKKAMSDQFWCETDVSKFNLIMEFNVSVKI